MSNLDPSPFVAIACGGTGGHLFPGLAVAEQLTARGCAVTLLISPKEVDQQAVKSQGIESFTLPAVALQSGQRFAFLRGFWKSWRTARQFFRTRRPQAALAMGGFTSAPPILAARRAGARTFLHESNTIPGRANRWLARFVDQAFVGFSTTAPRLHAHVVTVTGTPVRPQFQTRDAAECRTALGLDPAKPVVLVMGGSQGASGVNDLMVAALPLLGNRAPHWQWLHLTGANEADKVKQAYARNRMPASVHPFLAEMDLALSAASAVVSRAGASSLAELAAVQVPALLVPFPHAADNHQLHNARAFVATGAAQLLEQKDAVPETVARELLGLIEAPAVYGAMQRALAEWHTPKAAEQIADMILMSIARRADSPIRVTATTGAVCHHLRASDLPERKARPRPRERQVLAETGLPIGFLGRSRLFNRNT